MHRVATVIRNSKALFALGASLAGIPHYSAAQTTLLGFVRADSSNAPLANAEVAIPVLHIGSYTDSAGRFRLDHIKPGDYDVVVRHLGFAPQTTRMSFQANETTAQQFQLARSVTTLAKVKVASSADTARSIAVDNATAFEARRAKGFGSFITSDELYAAREHQMTTVLHTIPQLGILRLNTGQMVAASTDSGRRCLSQVYLDGVKVNYPFDVNSLSPGSLRGVEFYPSLNAPGDYQASPGYCGVLVLWTQLRSHR